MSWGRAVAWVWVFALAGLAGTGGLDAAGALLGLRPAPRTTARVTTAVDGDTVHVLMGDRRETVRYIGIDTPETVKPGIPPQCYGKRASHFNARLVEGRPVVLSFDRERRDRYGRLLAYVRLAAAPHTFVNAALVGGGYATAFPFEPNTAHASRFARLESRARRRGLGLWGRC